MPLVPPPPPPLERKSWKCSANTNKAYSTARVEAGVELSINSMHSHSKNLSGKLILFYFNFILDLVGVWTPTDIVMSKYAPWS